MSLLSPIFHPLAAIIQYSDEELRAIEAHLYPGLGPNNSSATSSFSGFLAKGERLRDVIERDFLFLASKGTTPERVGADLEQALAAYNPIAYRGMQYCPFGCAQGTNKDYSISLGEKAVTLSGLMPHLIGAHGFFEGAVKYRLDPADALAIIAAPAPTPVKKMPTPFYTGRRGFHITGTPDDNP